MGVETEGRVGKTGKGRIVRDRGRRSEGSRNTKDKTEDGVNEGDSYSRSRLSVEPHPPTIRIPLIHESSPTPGLFKRVVQGPTHGVPLGHRIPLGHGVPLGHGTLSGHRIPSRTISVRSTLSTER